LLCNLYSPIIPHTCSELRGQLNTNIINIPSKFHFELKQNHKLGKIKPLFEKIKKEQINEWKNKFSGNDIRNGSTQ
jgi:methionyl-tRNA synthetase